MATLNGMAYPSLGLLTNTGGITPQNGGVSFSLKSSWDASQRARGMSRSPGHSALWDRRRGLASCGIYIHLQYRIQQRDTVHRSSPNRPAIDLAYHHRWHDQAWLDNRRRY